MFMVIDVVSGKHKTYQIIVCPLASFDLNVTNVMSTQINDEELPAYIIELVRR
jgi:hypothetical protein